LKKLQPNFFGKSSKKLEASVMTSNESGMEIGIQHAFPFCLVEAAYWLHEKSKMTCMKRHTGTMKRQTPGFGAPFLLLKRHNGTIM
jgi:hypothetical protein